MRTLEKNVRNVWGEQGKAWLKQLPAIIDTLSRQWSLTDIHPVDNLSYNYVARATQHSNTAVVLKISCDPALIGDEYKALNHFNGKGSIKVIDADTQYQALLLEQAVPGHLLKGHYPNNIEDTIAIYANIAKRLSAIPAPQTNCTHVSYWCRAIDRITDARITAKQINTANKLRSFLLNSAPHEYLCHGDLHCENIIQDSHRWLSIDPKGIIGEAAFEVATFDFIDSSEWLRTNSIKNILCERITLLANVLDIDKERLLAWVYLRTVISAQWFIEDNGNPDQALRLLANLPPPTT